MNLRERRAAELRRLRGGELGDDGPQGERSPAVAWERTQGLQEGARQVDMTLPGLWGNTVRYTVPSDIPNGGGVLAVDGAATPLIFATWKWPAAWWFYASTLVLNRNGSAIPDQSITLQLSVNIGVHKDVPPPFRIPVVLGDGLPTGGIIQPNWPQLIGSRVQVFLDLIENADPNLVVPAGFQIQVSAGVVLQSTPP